MQMHTPPTWRGGNMKETHLLQQKLRSTVLHSPLGKDSDCHYSSHHWGSCTLFRYWECMKEWKVQNEWMNIAGFTWLTITRTYIYTTEQYSMRICHIVCTIWCGSTSKAHVCKYKHKTCTRPMCACLSDVTIHVFSNVHDCTWQNQWQLVSVLP